MLIFHLVPFFANIFKLWVNFSFLEVEPLGITPMEVGSARSSVYTLTYLTKLTASLNRKGATYLRNHSLRAKKLDHLIMVFFGPSRGTSLQLSGKVPDSINLVISLLLAFFPTGSKISSKAILRELLYGTPFLKSFAPVY